MQTTLDAHRSGGAQRRFRFHDFEPAAEDFRTALTEGLAADRKSVPCRFLYDQRGSELFDAICEQPEYYPTRTELQILAEHAPDMAARMGTDVQLIELGSGSSAKVGLLLAALQDPAAYVPIDISREHLLAAAERVAASHPGLDVHAVCADYSQAFSLPTTDGRGRRVAFYPGSTIGNFTPDQARGFLRRWASRLGGGAQMLIGVDLQKSTAELDAAYDDAAGVTAAFSLNVLARANRELGADFDLDGFRHQARYLADEGRVAIHLRSLKAQTAQVGGRRFEFADGELIHIEDSWKYTVDGFRALAESSGYAPDACWTDPKQRFSVHLLQVR